MATQECSLADLPAHVTARIVSIEEDWRATLVAHGIRPGVTLAVDDDAPFGGPRIVRLGRARLAVARVIARAISVRREPDSGEASGR